jgi:hypothetical protein
MPATASSASSSSLAQEEWMTTVIRLGSSNHAKPNKRCGIKALGFSDDHHPETIPLIPPKHDEPHHSHGISCPTGILLPNIPLPELPSRSVLSRLCVNIVSGVVGFMLSCTLSVACANVVAGHHTPLSSYVVYLIEMNLLGTVIISSVLIRLSHAPYALGTMDIFTYVVPIL